MDHSDSEVPKLQDSQCHIQAKQVERFLIPESNASLSPYAVMVHFILTRSTGAAVVDSWKFEIFAQIAILISRRVELVSKFLRRRSLQSQFRQFGWLVPSPDGLAVAPQTHEYIDIGQYCHVVTFLVSQEHLEVLHSGLDTCVSR